MVAFWSVWYYLLYFIIWLYCLAQVHLLNTLYSITCIRCPAAMVSCQLGPSVIQSRLAPGWLCHTTVAASMLPLQPGAVRRLEYLWFNLDYFIVIVTGWDIYSLWGKAWVICLPPPRSPCWRHQGISSFVIDQVLIYISLALPVQSTWVWWCEWDLEQQRPRLPLPWRLPVDLLTCRHGEFYNHWSDYFNLYILLSDQHWQSHG